ncbi:MAG: hypothetical protein U0271_04990 [Polyangiaceae bacterium]
MAATLPFALGACSASPPGSQQATASVVVSASAALPTNKTPVISAVQSVAPPKGLELDGDLREWGAIADGTVSITITEQGVAFAGHSAQSLYLVLTSSAPELPEVGFWSGARASSFYAYPETCEDPQEDSAFGPPMPVSKSECEAARATRVAVAATVEQWTRRAFRIDDKGVSDATSRAAITGARVAWGKDGAFEGVLPLGELPWFAMGAALLAGAGPTPDVDTAPVSLTIGFGPLEALSEQSGNQPEFRGDFVLFRHPTGSSWRRVVREFSGGRVSTDEIPMFQPLASYGDLSVGTALATSWGIASLRGKDVVAYLARPQPPETCLERGQRVTCIFFFHDEADDGEAGNLELLAFDKSGAPDELLDEHYSGSTVAFSHDAKFEHLRVETVVTLDKPGAGPELVADDLQYNAQSGVFDRKQSRKKLKRR